MQMSEVDDNYRNYTVIFRTIIKILWSVLENLPSVLNYVKEEVQLERPFLIYFSTYPY